MKKDGCSTLKEVTLKVLAAVLLAFQTSLIANITVVRPFEISAKTPSGNEIDKHVAAVLKQKNIAPANLCSDEVFLRRVFLDVTGRLPEPDEVRRFVNNTRPAKRAELIEQLLESDSFAEYAAMKWCDLLRVKAEFPINLWPNAVQAYHRWVYDAMRQNMPYDRFARELLTSSGSNYRVPQVNFYRAVQERTPSAIAAATALTFMGVRWEHLPAEQQRQLELFFSRIAYKETAEWKEEIVYLDPTATGSLTAVFPTGESVVIAAGQDPRHVFADWLTQPDNPWFAKAAVNRVWSRLMGRGIIHEPDDIRPDNTPSNPELLTFLARELTQADFDLKHIYRLILNSQTYQRSSIPRSNHPEAKSGFAYYPVRRLDAEVLIDVLNQITGTRESYSSLIPEPFTFIPDTHRTVTLADGSITSPFLEMFGRPARDTGLESERDNQPTDAQRLHLLNSSHIQRKIESSPRLRAMSRTAGRNPRAFIGNLYLTTLSRYPTREELAVAEDYFKTSGLRPNQAANDLVWSLINTKEFLYHH